MWTVHWCIQDKLQLSEIPLWLFLRAVNGGKLTLWFSGGLNPYNFFPPFWCETICRMLFGGWRKHLEHSKIPWRHSVDVSMQLPGKEILCIKICRYLFQKRNRVHLGPQETFRGNNFLCLWTPLIIATRRVFLVSGGRRRQEQYIWESSLKWNRRLKKTKT